MFFKPKEEKIRDKYVEYIEAKNIDKLKKGLKKSFWWERYCAAGGLMDLGPQAKEAIPDLIYILLNDNSADVVREACKALTKIGIASADALLKALRSLKSDRRKLFDTHADAVGIEIVEILANIGVEAVPYLIEILRISEALLSSHAMVELSHITGKDFHSEGEWINWFEKERKTEQRKTACSKCGKLLEENAAIPPTAILDLTFNGRPITKAMKCRSCSSLLCWPDCCKMEPCPACGSIGGFFSVMCFVA